MRRVRSFKLHPRDGYVRLVPGEGAPMSVRGEAAARAMELAAPVFAAVGGDVRALSLDLELGRLLCTVEAAPRPRVVRVDVGPGLDAILEAAAPLLAHLDALVGARVSS